MLSWEISHYRSFIFYDRQEDVADDVDSEDDFIEDPYNDSLSAAIAESAALAERERHVSGASGFSRDVKRKKTIRTDSYFSDEENTD